MRQPTVARDFPLPAALIGAAVILVGLIAGATRAQTEAERYFDETGHAVRGPFLAFFDSHGGLGIFGYPITDEFVNANGLLVQYFQRARFEWHPSNPTGYRVQLGLIGDELGYSQPRLAASQIPAPTNPNCQYFPETGHSACYAFLGYFRGNGGIEVFGYPISEYYIEGDRIVQAFQRARMEWHPEKPQKVQLTMLGSAVFNASGESRALLEPRASPNQLRAVTRLNVQTSVSRAVTGRAGSQTIYAFVADQHNNPIQGVAVSAVIYLASGSATYVLPPTDARGMTKLNIPFGQTKPGEKVTIDVTATLNTLVGRSRGSFLPWW